MCRGQVMTCAMLICTLTSVGALKCYMGMDNDYKEVDCAQSVGLDLMNIVAPNSTAGNNITAGNQSAGHSCFTKTISVSGTG